MNFLLYIRWIYVLCASTVLCLMNIYSFIVRLQEEWIYLFRIAEDDWVCPVSLTSFVRSDNFFVSLSYFRDVKILWRCVVLYSQLFGKFGSRGILRIIIFFSRLFGREFIFWLLFGFVVGWMRPSNVRDLNDFYLITSYYYL